MRRDRALLLALLLSALVLLPRAFLIARAHSECYDDEYHLVRGARFFLGTLDSLSLHNPPLGQALTALPMQVTNRNPAWTGTLYDHSLRPETTLMLTALWRSLLFLPVAGVVFLWCRRLYGPAAGWLALLLVLAEPTVAAHVPLPALDALGAGAILLAAFLIWRWFEEPSAGRLVAASCAAAAALLIKHTALALPLVAAGYAALFWIVRPVLARQDRKEWVAALPRRIGAVAAAIAVTLAALWVFLLFDVHRPVLPETWQESPTTLSRLLDRPLPGGVYVESVLRSGWHADLGHPSYLLGEKHRGGWWYYFPVVLAYKLPIGFAVVLLLALLSLHRVKPRFEEWGLLLPGLIFTILIMATRINIGLRIFLPALLFLLMLGSRAAAAGAPRWLRGAAWAGWLIATLHVASFHPDYLSYINMKRDRVWLQVSDSNLDWGQGLKQARDWIDRKGKATGRPIFLLYFGDPNSPRRVFHYLRDRATLMSRRDPLPLEGLLIASPVWVAGPFDTADQYAALRRVDPIDVIGHSMLVYDLARLPKEE